MTRIGKRPTMTEKDFQQQIIDLAHSLGWMAYHTWNSNHSAAGFPDLVLVRKGNIIFAELKREGKDATPAQMEWLEALAECKWVQVFIWRPSDFEAIHELLQYGGVK